VLDNIKMYSRVQQRGKKKGKERKNKEAETDVKDECRD
jgi:hypothetical protein